ncbi:MAG: hypothetical protein LBP63_06925 [Prevotellaceae bacterium]|jgi:hypothetical protein|nr:hypothetical protein [Prevotellaceae bacterium]
MKNIQNILIFFIALAFAMIATQTQISAQDAQTNKKPSLVVFVVGMDNQVGDFLAILIGNELGGGERYEVITRTEAVQKKLKELREYEQSGNVNEGELIEWGRQNNVSMLCMVTSIKLDEHMFAAQLTDVKSNKLVGSGDYSSASLGSADLKKAAETLARQLQGEKVTETVKSTIKTSSENSISISDYNNSRNDSIIKVAANLITKACRKPEKYDYDEQRFNSLETYEKVELENMILSNSKFAIEPAEVSDSRIAFFLRKRTSLRTQWAVYIPLKVDDALLLFLDGNLIGIGMASTGLLVTLPKNKFEGRHTLSLYACTFEIFSMPVDLSTKNYYLFDWGKKKEVNLIN